MDIDEFLDREIPAGKKAIEAPAAFPGENANDAKSQLKKEEAGTSPIENRYSTLWNQLSSNSLSWNAALYNEIASISDELGRKALSEESRISRERQKSTEMVKNAHSALDSGNYAAALGIYSGIVSLRDSIPDAFFERKKELNAEILKIYSRLQDLADSKLAGSISSSLQKTEDLVNKSFSAIARNNLEEAKSLYLQALGIYKGIPSGYFARRIETGKMLLQLYKELSIHQQINELQGQLGQGQKISQNRDYIRTLSEISSHHKEIGKRQKRSG